MSMDDIEHPNGDVTITFNKLTSGPPCPWCGGAWPWLWIKDVRGEIIACTHDVRFEVPSSEREAPAHQATIHIELAPGLDKVLDHLRGITRHRQAEEET